MPACRRRPRAARSRPRRAARAVALDRPLGALHGARRRRPRPARAPPRCRRRPGRRWRPRARPRPGRRRRARPRHVLGARRLQARGAQGVRDLAGEGLVAGGEDQLGVLDVAAEHAAGPRRGRGRRRRRRAACRAAGTSPRESTSTPVRWVILPAVRGDRGGQLGGGHREDDEVVRASSSSDGLDAGGPSAGSSSCSRAGSALRRSRSTSMPARASATASAVPASAPMIAARRSGGRPPSHSHWSITLGQMRSVTAAASGPVAVSTLRELQRRADAHADLVRADQDALADRLGAAHRDRDDRRAGLEREPADAALGLAERAGADARALGEDQHRVAALEDRLRGLDHVRVGGAAADRERAERAQEPAERPELEQLLLGHVVDRAAVAEAEDERVDERAVVGDEDHRPALRDVLAADPAQAPVQVRERLQPGAHQPVDDRVDALGAGAGVVGVEIHGVGDSSSPFPYTEARRGVTVALMALDRTRTLRGALAGAAAAAVWAAQQPLDQRVFDVPVRRRRAARALRHRRSRGVSGRAGDAHRQRRRVRRDLRQRGARAADPAARCAGRWPGWPSTSRPGRARPGCRASTPPPSDLPELWGSGRAFAQATWRHLLFGTVLGELERRLNPPDSEPNPIDPADAASNGHGSAEYVVSLN